MLDTKLILIEGLPGTGKSTTAQYISRCLASYGVDHKWWYEEEVGHPVYVFSNEESMNRTIDDLSNGNYEKVVEMALEQWRRFSHSLEGDDKVIVMDSCLFGYLTWTLFPMEVPGSYIKYYLDEVERIIRSCKPSLIYFYHNDIDASLRRICQRRGGDTEERFIRNVTESKYGQKRKLNDFDGMVSFWQDYRLFTDHIYMKTTIRKIAVENSAGKWEDYLKRITEFLNIPPLAPSIKQLALDSLTGTYSSEDRTCQIVRSGEQLYIDGFQGIWPNSRLLPIEAEKYAVESLPVTVTFRSNELSIAGPRLFEGEMNRVLKKVE